MTRSNAMRFMVQFSARHCTTRYSARHCTTLSGARLGLMVLGSGYYV